MKATKSAEKSADKVVDPTSIEVLSEETQQTSTDIITRASAVTVIVTDEELVQAGQLDKALADLIKAVEAEYKPAIKRWNDGHKTEIARMNKWLLPLEAGRKELKRVIGLCMDAREVARRQEEERLRIQAQAEADKLAEDEKNNRVQALVDAGKVDEAAELMVDDVVVEFVAPVKVETVKPVGFGMSMVDSWSAELTDFRALIKAVADGRVPAMALEANMVFLNGQARTMKSTLDFPGVRAVKTSSPRSSGR